jgi:hypothetical protein
MAALPAFARAETLVFKGDNKWVAPEDNKPLQALLTAARGGKTIYKVKLPNEGRELAVMRLQVVANLLEREAKKAIVMEEVGTAAVNTLVVE